LTRGSGRCTPDERVAACGTSRPPDTSGAPCYLTAELVVLSACRTTRAAVVAGEGVRGLSARLLLAGARSLLATQWRIKDRAAVPLVYDIYRGLAAGEGLTEAVQRAGIAARRRGAPVREWAAFTVVGDPGVQIPLRVPARDGVRHVATGRAALVTCRPAGVAKLADARDLKSLGRKAVRVRDPPLA
jgi:hypothetical protein